MTGLVLGKFCPLHRGHLALIDFARKRCDRLIVLVCASDNETIPGEMRLQWVKIEFTGNDKIEPVLLNYSESELPNTSVPSKQVSKIWADKIAMLFAGIGVFFTSETYGDFVAEYLGCRHVPFDFGRNAVPVSATQIRSNPFNYWDFIAESAKPYFGKKICLVGTESTGKSVLTEKLAAHYQTAFVPEMAREIISETNDCMREHLQEIAALHARAILEKAKDANQLLFVDTDLNITRSYSEFLFGEKLEVEDWIAEANTFDLYLYLEADADFIQDGTRLDKNRRDALDACHKKAFAKQSTYLENISGNWEERLAKCIAIIDKLFL